MIPQLLISCLVSGDITQKGYDKKRARLLAEERKAEPHYGNTCSFLHPYNFNLKFLSCWAGIDSND